MEDTGKQPATNTEANEANDAFAELRSKTPFSAIDEALLRRVFVHRSYLNEAEGPLESNERLEFLGDVVLGAIVSRMLYDRFPDMDEGGLTALRSRLVNRQTLASVAAGLALGGPLLMSKGLALGGGRDNPALLADTFEALVAAIYLDRGLGEVSAFIEGLFSPVIDESLEGPGPFDFKPRLQALAQRRFGVEPVYRVVSEEGPDHMKIFHVEVSVEGELMGSASAGSKKEAEQLAAGKALEKLDEDKIDKPDKMDES